MESPRRAALARVVLLVAVLALHLEARLGTHRTMPADQKHFWPGSYLVSLSFLSGQGFSYVLPADASTDVAVPTQVNELRQRPGPAQPVMDFLSGKGRQHLEPHELTAYLASDVKRVPIDLAGSGLLGSRWEATRILDIRLAALLWKLFGIRWSVLFAFYSLVSTLAALCVFFLVRRLTRSYWAGLVGALGFAASPLERIAGAWSIRDANPLWFTAFAFCLLFQLAGGSARSRALTYLGWFAIGAGSALGLGWRSDAQLVPPFVLLGLVSILAASRAPLRRIALAALVCAAGALSLRAAIDRLGPSGSRGQGGSIVFEISWYGEHMRSDLVGTENAFQVKQDDYLTLYQANYFHQQRTREPFVAREIYNPTFQASVRSMYLELACYNAYSWWKVFPRFLWQTTHVDRWILPGPSAGGLPIDDTQLPLGETRPLIQLVYAHAMKPYVSLLPYLFAAGLALGLLRGEARVLVLLLAAYFVYYSAALFMVLPESKHWPPLLLPLHVIAAAGLWWALTALPWLRAATRAGWRASLAPPLLLVALAAAAWLAGGAVAYSVSRAQRRSLTQSVLALAELPPDDPAPPLPAKVITFATSGDAANARVGYLLKIRGARRPVDLLCVHLRDPTPEGSTPLYYYTRHTLEPEREQLFFVNPVTGTAIGDDRPYTLHVRVRGRAEILSVQKLDLSSWSVGLPLSLLFTREQDSAVARMIDDHAQLPVTDEFVTRDEALAFVRPAVDPGASAAAPP
jgi:hypothetical protein